MLRYGTPDTPFLKKIKLFSQSSSVCIKLCVKIVIFIFCCVLFVYNSINTKNVYFNPVKNSKIFSASNPCKILTLLWYYTGFVIWHPYVPFFFHFVDTSKIATSTSFFNNKRGIFSSKRDRMGHKKFQRFQKWGQMLWRTITSHISKLPA